MKLMRKRAAYDPFLGDDDAREAAQYLQQGDWIPTMALLRETPDRSLQMNLITSEQVDLAAFETWAEAHPTALSLTMLAMRQMTDAWAIGRTKPGEQTQAEIDDAFRAQLRVADRTVAQACGKDPHFADAWAAAIPIATGLGLGVKSALGRFERAHAIVPFHRNATMSMLRAKFARWGGSHDAMFDFARHVSEKTGPGSDLQSALPIAHLEFVAANGKVRDYFSGHDTKRELKRIVDKYLAATPSGPALPGQLEALNSFVATLGRMYPVPSDALEECIRRIDGRPTAMPWRRGDNDLLATYEAFIAKLH